MNRLEELDQYDDLKAIQKEEKLDKVMDVIQSRFGFKACCMSYSLSEAGTAIGRSRLIGGHGLVLEGGSILALLIK